MKKVVFRSIILVALFAILVNAKPMESLPRYNIIMVHGASD